MGFIDALSNKNDQVTGSEQRLSGVMVYGYTSVNVTWSWKARFWHTLTGSKLGTIMQNRQDKASNQTNVNKTTTKLSQ